MASTRRISHERVRAKGPRRLRRRGLLVALVAVPLATGLAYLIARETSVFAMRTIAVSGAPSDLERQVRSALDRFDGTSLVALDPGRVAQAVERLPAVRSAQIDREFPHGLSVTVTPEKAVAVLRRAGDAWLVAASGRVLATLEPGRVRALPRVWVSVRAGALEPGDVLPENEGAAAVRALSRIPPGFPQRVLTAHGTLDQLTLVLPGKLEVRLGDAADLGLKLDVAAEVLQAVALRGQPELAYLDVSLPERPVGSQKSQVDTSA